MIDRGAEEVRELERVKEWFRVSDRVSGLVQQYIIKEGRGDRHTI